MTTSSRLRGNVLPIFTIKVGAAAAVSYADDLKKINLKAADKDAKDLTFAEAAQGVAQDFTLTVTAIASFDAAALYGFAWANKGTEVTIVYGPYGNAVPTATKPHFTLTATVSTPDWSAEAKAATDTTGAEAEIVFKGTSTVTLIKA